MRFFFFAVITLSFIGCNDVVSEGPKTDLGTYESITTASGVTSNYRKSDKGFEYGVTVGDVKQGTWADYNNEGRPAKMTSYVNGAKSGVELEFGNRGQVTKMTNYLDGKLEGRFVEYKSGFKVKEGIYANEKLDGTYKEYAKGGKIQKEIQFKNGVQNGRMTYYNENEEKTLEYIFKNGEKVSGGMVEK